MESQGVFYCVLRGKPRENVFFSDQDKQDFIQAVADSKRRHAGKIHAFAVLESQVHLVISSREGDPHNFIQTVRETYAASYRRRNSKDGCVFEDCYTHRPCHDTTHLLPLIRHVHYLPVTFGHTHHPNLSRFTSHAAYLGDTRYGFVDSDEVLAQLSPDRTEARRRYQALSATAVSAVELAQVFMVKEPEKAPAQAEPLTLSDIASVVSQVTGVSLRVMQGKGRSTQAVAARRMLIATAVTEHHYPVTTVAEFLCVHHSYVSRLTFGRGRD